MLEGGDTMTALEAAVRNLWLCGPYQATGVCANCEADARLAGNNPSTRICIHCFEFVFNCRFPSHLRKELA